MGNIHKPMCAVYRSFSVNRSTVGSWDQRVKASGSGERERHDRSRSGHPATATSPNMFQCADGIIHMDRHITNRQLAIQLSVNNGSTMVIIDALDYLKVCARWVRQNLTPEHRRCWSILMLSGRPFCPRSSISQRRKGSQLIGIIHNHQKKKSSR